ncbi:MFS transporter [Falsirhodobacter deserti]|uniref:MFS transporter n=1 Tax=Falsirhodobacter deserti TaxID=1365611 RepID=UPI001F4E8DA2|nr:MFS transporter [Falsirhodobacter deserti]
MSTPASTTAERDARRLHSDTHHAHEADPGEMSIGVIIGRAAEFFDFFVFAIACVLVFPARLFPFVDPLTGTLYSFAILALGFLARPFGSVFFHWVDRNKGRGAKLTFAMMLLGTSTVAMGLIPTYETLGAWALILLCIFRAAQGFALGGTWDGLASLLALSAPENKRGWYAMVPQLGTPIALIVATALFVYLVMSMSATDFLDWGWRYPFFVAFAINVVALFARVRLVASPDYDHMFKSSDLTPTGMGETLRAESRGILLGAFTPLASFAMLHMLTVFPLAYVFLYTENSPAGFLTTLLIGSFVGLAATAASGVLSDRIGRRKLLIGSAVGIAIFAIVGPILLSFGGAGQTLYVMVGFILVGLSFGQASGAVAASFNKGNRYTASAITSDLSWIIGAGLAPFVALFLTASFGIWAAGAYLLSGAICTLIALRINKLVSNMGRN